VFRPRRHHRRWSRDDVHARVAARSSTAAFAVVAAVQQAQNEKRQNASPQRMETSTWTPARLQAARRTTLAHLAAEGVVQQAAPSTPLRRRPQRVGDRLAGRVVRKNYSPARPLLAARMSSTIA